MWSPSLVPKPKDWPEYVDIVGTFFEPLQEQQPLRQPQQQSVIISNLNSTPNKMANVNVDSTESFHPAAISPSNFTPSPELVAFLKRMSSPIVYVGFGSMVIDNPESIFRMFLEASALAGVRVLIQSGWSQITQELFNQLAIEAERKAFLVFQADRELSRSGNFMTGIFEQTDVVDDDEDYVQVSSV